MKLRNLILACSLALPLVAFSSETHRVSFSSESTESDAQLSEEELQQRRERELLKLMDLPCEPFPKCA